MVQIDGIKIKKLNKIKLQQNEIKIQKPMKYEKRIGHYFVALSYAK